MRWSSSHCGRLIRIRRPGRAEGGDVRHSVSNLRRQSREGPPIEGAPWIANARAENTGRAIIVIRGGSGGPSRLKLDLSADSTNSSHGPGVNAREQNLRS